ncbi:MAG: HNH endonuclease [Oscillospiraceae bacterium]|nr:HNH endonuclease [Oscillospiraceae bacterium]
MNERTKALQIPKRVKEAVAARDSFGYPPHPCCILCCSPEGLPEAHYIPRSRGGLGVEENVVTLCRPCHTKLDQTVERQDLLRQVKEYLQSKYPEWDEAALVYRREL